MKWKGPWMDIRPSPLRTKTEGTARREVGFIFEKICQHKLLMYVHLPRAVRNSEVAGLKEKSELCQQELYWCETEENEEIFSSVIRISHLFSLWAL